MSRAAAEARRPTTDDRRGVGDLSRVSIEAALGGVVTPVNGFCCDDGTTIAAFARRAGIAAHLLPMLGKPNLNAPDFRLNKVSAYQDRLKEWLRRFHGVAANTLPTYLGWRRTLEALDQQASPSRPHLRR